MSSMVDAEGIVAAAVVVPAAAAAAVYGAGWVAWQAGKLIVDANRAADRQIEEKKRQMEEAARHRRMAALAAHSQLVDMCHEILSKLDGGPLTGSILRFAETEQLRHDLNRICSEPIPEDVTRLENITAVGYLQLDRIVQKQASIASMDLSGPSGLYQGLSVADLMDDLRIAVKTMTITATEGTDIKAADPDVLERVKLNRRFAEVTGKIMHGLGAVEQLSQTHGLTTAAYTWFDSCFNGIDTLIETLCRPTTTNEELKKGILRLEEALDQYRSMAPTIEKDIKKMLALYRVYVDAAQALGEPVERITAFQNARQIEERLRYLQTRAARAQECAKIYRTLGPAAYLCYAWDQELQAMGYEVHTRKKITEMAGQKPERARLGKSKLPFYRWDQADMMQLYSMTDQCSLQVIVHEDGTVSMQTLAEAVDDRVVPIQRAHCSQMKTLYARLRQNWFILYEYEEMDSAEQVTTVSTWRAAGGRVHRRGGASHTPGRRVGRTPAANAKHQQ